MEGLNQAVLPKSMEFGDQLSVDSEGKRNDTNHFPSFASHVMAVVF